MISEIIILVNTLPFYGGGKCIEIAKGKHAIIKDWKQSKEQIKRAYKTTFK